MHSDEPLPQRITHQTPYIELSRRPALVVEPAATAPGSVLALLGVGLFALGLAGLVVTARRSPLRWDLLVGGLIFTAFGAGMTIAVLRTLLVSKRIGFDQAAVTVSRRGPLGRAEWTLPYASFRGIQIRRVLLPARYGVGRSVHHVELSHEDPRYSIRLLNVSAGALSEAELSAYAEACARALGLPVLEPEGRANRR